MLPRYHFLAALVPSVAIALISPIYGILFMIGAYLIDFDHYMIYVMAFRELNLRNAIRFFEKNVLHELNGKPVMVFLPFHNIETFVLLLALSAYIPLLYFLFFGMVFHYILDLCFDYIIFKRFIREFSLMGYLLKSNKFSIKSIKRA